MLEAKGRKYLPKQVLSTEKRRIIHSLQQNYDIINNNTLKPFLNMTLPGALKVGRELKYNPNPILRTR